MCPDEKSEVPEAVSETLFWVAKINVNGRTFRTAKEYTDYMTENKLWGKHYPPLTKAEWEEMKAKKLSETGTDLGTLKFTPGDSKKGGDIKI
jgi:ubiquinone biosynthesis protein Coq4